MTENSLWHLHLAVEEGNWNNKVWKRDLASRRALPAPFPPYKKLCLSQHLKHYKKAVRGRENFPEKIWWRGYQSKDREYENGRPKFSRENLNLWKVENYILVDKLRCLWMQYCYCVLMCINKLLKCCPGCQEFLIASWLSYSSTFHNQNSVNFREELHLMSHQ